MLTDIAYVRAPRVAPSPSGTLTNLLDGFRISSRLASEIRSAIETALALGAPLVGNPF